MRADQKDPHPKQNWLLAKFPYLPVFYIRHVFSW